MPRVTATASVHSILTNEINETRALNYFEMTYRKCYNRCSIFVSAFYDLSKGPSGYFEHAQDLATQDRSLRNLKSAFIRLVSGMGILPIAVRPCWWRCRMCQLN